MLTVFPGVSKFRLSEQVCSIKETTVGYNIPGASKFGVGEGMSMILELTRNCDWNKECRCGKHLKMFFRIMSKIYFFIAYFPIAQGPNYKLCLFFQFFLI